LKCDKRTDNGKTTNDILKKKNKKIKIQIINSEIKMREDGSDLSTVKK